jgi:O-antigen ligase
MIRLFKKIEQYLPVLVFISFFLCKVPPLTIFLLNSYPLAKVILFVLFLYLVVLVPKEKQVLIFKKPIVRLLLIYFIVRSLSVFNAINLGDFLIGYQRFIFGFIVFFVILLFPDKDKLIKIFFSIFLITSVVNIITDFLTYFFPEISFPLFRNTLYPANYTLGALNFMRGRTFLNYSIELLLPMLFYYLWCLAERKELRDGWKLIISVSFLFILNIAIIVSAVLSGWRIRILDYFFSVILCLLFFASRFKRKIVIPLITLSVLLAFFLLLYLIIISSSVSVLDRFELLNSPQETQDSQVNATPVREELWPRAIELGLSFPFGVGFDNFFYYFTDKIFQQRITYERETNLSLLVFQSPHNIFLTNMAEGGWISFLLFLSLIVCFLYKDFRFLKIKKEPNMRITVLIIQFWTLMLYGFFHPAESVEFYFLFFSLRGLIESFS